MSRCASWAAPILLVLVCAALAWIPPSSYPARLFGQSGTLVITVCNPAGGGSQRVQWTCAGDFTPDDDRPVRQVSFESTSRYEVGEEVKVDARSDNTTEVRPRTTAFSTLLLCPLLIIGLVVVGTARAWLTAPKRTSG